MNYHISKCSENVKTGRILVTSTSSDSCPPSCPFRITECYGKTGPLSLHWRKVDSKKYGATTIADICLAVVSLDLNSIWRHNQAGDLPGKGEYISRVELEKIVQANYGKRGFTHTHKHKLVRNHAIIKSANDNGFAVNLSANNLTHADELHALQIGPVVVVLPSDAPKRLTTPNGLSIITCPATYKEGFNCKKCGICARIDREFIVGFPAHGAAKRKVDTIARG
jgi:hypothetical protein